MNSTASDHLRESDIEIIRLRNAHGDSAVILTLGATLAELNIHTESQGTINTILGYKHPQTYIKDPAYHGVIAGRYCNRIANSRFSIGSETYRLASNEGDHQLHGGPAGFNTRVWAIEEQNNSDVTLRLFSEHGDQGFPGNLNVTVRYALAEPGCLDITWEATTDKDTVVCLTNHSYFNLAGYGDIRNHSLRIAADHYTPVDSDLIPTGALKTVQGSVFDLREYTALNTLLNSEESEITAFGGLDHNWARGREGEMQVSAELLCPDTGLQMQMSTTLPGLQCYTGNNLASTGVHGCREGHESHEGICLEAQYYPNSPNEPTFPSPVLRAGDCMKHRIRYHFSEQARAQQKSTS